MLKRFVSFVFFVGLFLAASASKSAAQVDVKVDPASGIARSILVNGFDFAPSDRFEQRSGDGFYHTGDVRFAVKTADGSWKWFSSSKGSSIELAGAPLRVNRRWERAGDAYVLRIELVNESNADVELGDFGFALSFNNILTGRSLSEAHEKCSFSDPYIGLDAGYVQVSRLKGTGPALVVMPEGETPFEAWRTITEPMKPQQTFEGTFEWMVHSKASAETAWRGASQWNEPTSEIIKAGATRTFSLKFVAAPDIRSIEQTLIANNRPVAVGVPGYILPNDQNGDLFIRHRARVSSVSAEPKDSLSAKVVGTTKNGWQRISVRSNGWGRARLTIRYADGTRQTIHYYLTKPATNAVNDLGRFLFTKQWFEKPDDPFGRSPSVISYDRELEKPVEQDNRAWIAGLGDEAGSGSWLAAAMKQYVATDIAEISQFERFIDEVLWGRLQYKDGENRYGVRKSLFYYAPDLLKDYKYDPNYDWKTWASWKKDHAESIGRGYNYPHVVAAYWSMYRIARNRPGLVKNHPWKWYLDQAIQTTRFAFGKKPDGKYQVEYVELGLMEGTVFLELLQDLKREGMKAEAAEIEAMMKERADRWSREEYPFGSEMAWDSTGQEEVYNWCRYFGYDDKALVSLNSIVGYMPTVPHWGYNGNARRYWDFLYGGKLRRIERQIHHYGSGMNAIPVLAHYRENPDDFHLLRIGYGGATGALSNIDQEGFASAAFHASPDALKWDAYSGDYGPNFFGFTINAATYVVKHPEFGWISFGGNVSQTKSAISVEPKDALRQRIFIAPLGLWLTLDAGNFERVEIARNGRTVKLSFAAQNQSPQALLRIEQTVKGGKNWRPAGAVEAERGGFRLPSGKWIVLNG